MLVGTPAECIYRHGHGQLQHVGMHLPRRSNSNRRKQKYAHDGTGRSVNDGAKSGHGDRIRCEHTRHLPALSVAPSNNSKTFGSKQVSVAAEKVHSCHSPVPDPCLDAMTGYWVEVEGMDTR